MKESVKMLVQVLAVLIVIISLTFLLIHIYSVSTAPPFSEQVRVDSLIQIRDSLILEVNHIDSIKNAEIIKVKSLDNDSTLELFYKLIRED